MLKKESYRKYQRKKKKLQKQALDMWKQIIIQIYGPNCEICGGNWKITPHHFYFKGSVAHLKYDLDNGIVLCGKCHASLHWKGQDQKLVEDKIVEIRGEEWLARLKKKKDNRPEGSYQTLKYYEGILQKLNDNKKIKKETT